MRRAGRTPFPAGASRTRRQSASVSTTGAFRVTGKEPEFWWPDSGKLERAAAEMAAKVEWEALRWEERVAPPPLPVQRQRFVADSPETGPTSEYDFTPDPAVYRGGALYPPEDRYDVTDRAAVAGMARRLRGA